MGEPSSTGKKRGRPPKNPVTEINSIKNTNTVVMNSNIEEEQYLYAKEQTVSEISSYSDMTYNSMSYFGLNIFDLYDSATISNMIKDPMSYNQQIRHLSQQLYSAHGLYGQSVDYCTSLPTLDYVIIPKGKNKVKRENNKQMMEWALNTIHHKEIMRDSLFKGMIDGVSFYYAEFTKTNFTNDIKSFSDFDIENILELNQVKEINSMGINMSILPLPTDYTRIVGRINSTYKIAFNLRYFEGLSSNELRRKLSCFPKEIRDAYEKNKKGNTSANNWIVLDYTKTIVSKVRSKLEEPYGRPMCLGAIKDILYSFYYNDTKRSQLDELNNRIIYQTLPEGKDKNLCGLTEKQAKQQHEAVRDAVMNKNTRNSTSFFTVQPTTKIDQIKVDTSIFDNKNETNLTENIGADIGFMASLLTGTGSGSYSAQANNLQLLLSEMFMWIEPIALELVKVINKNIIKDEENEVGLYYLPCSTITRKDFTQQMKDLYLQGKGSLTAWIASTGFNSEAYLSLMNDELDKKFDEKYLPHPTSYNTSGDTVGDNKGGRKESEVTTDGNAVAKNYNTNDTPSPSDNK